MKKLPTIEELHQEWERSVLTPDIPKTQIVEMKKAFFAGAFAVFNNLTGDVADLPEEEGVKHLSQLLLEFQDFFANKIYHLYDR